MPQFEEQVNIKFCVQLSKTVLQTEDMIMEAFGNKAISWAAV
jgi:hypothetical protein